jgi:hypothetical protein
MCTVYIVFHSDLYIYILNTVVWMSKIYTHTDMLTLSGDGACLINKKNGHAYRFLFM